MTATVTSAITPSNQPPARISTTGSYPSPRGCTGTMLSVGTADRTSNRRRFSPGSTVRLWRSRHSAGTLSYQRRDLSCGDRSRGAADISSNCIPCGRLASGLPEVVPIRPNRAARPSGAANSGAEVSGVVARRERGRRERVRLRQSPGATSAISAPGGRPRRFDMSSST
jgi:hypothetical protein